MQTAQLRGIPVFVLGVALAPACHKDPPSAENKDAASTAQSLNQASKGGTTLRVGPAATPPLGPPAERVQPQNGMVFVPPGALVVGSSPEKRPRRADREIAGEQVMLDGFYIDMLSYPNEEGAIPVTSVTHDEAEGLCRERGKRLCTDLEWERACKGPDNRSFEYGETYVESVCRTGRPAALRPGGYFSGCQSDFGVRDMHGGPFEWTASPYLRGTTSSEMVIKGGNGTPGQVVGRCANLEKAERKERSGVIGFRCCSGGEGSVKVELEYKFGPGLVPRVKFDEDLEAAMFKALPSEAESKMRRAGRIRRERVWLWHPVANEEIHLMALCGRNAVPLPRPECGLLAARVAPGSVETLAWISSGEWVANLHHPGAMTHLLLLGGDRRGGFKQPLTYRYGDVTVGDVSWSYQQKKKGH